jgi:drug/metabolite transporter (DMT)-like permease
MNALKQQTILPGLAASLLFSVTFILNRLMSVEGGHWIWSASLRFYWMLPFFGAIVWYQGGLIAGLLLAPLIYRNRSHKQAGSYTPALFSGIILLGVLIMQVRQAEQISLDSLLKGVIPVLVAAFAYPLGNRKMMQLTDGRLTVFQRILGMLLCSMPFWLLLNVYGLTVEGSVPSGGQYVQTFIVAVFSGVLATALFFTATDKARGHEQQLAAVEATQSTEVLFALIGEVIILGSPLPDVYGIVGMALVMLGMVLHSTGSRAVK